MPEGHRDGEKPLRAAVTQNWQIRAVQFTHRTVHPQSSELSWHRRGDQDQAKGEGNTGGIRCFLRKGWSFLAQAFFYVCCSWMCITKGSWRRGSSSTRNCWHARKLRRTKTAPQPLQVSALEPNYAENVTPGFPAEMSQKQVHFLQVYDFYIFGTKR